MEICNDKKQEYILCAAIHYNDGKYHLHQPNNIQEGYVVCGRRHHNCININFILTGNPTRCETSTQGFITSKDRFLNRIEANMIAISQGQTIGNVEGDELISEDLY